MNRYAKTLPVLIFVLFLTACGGGVSGTYGNELMTVKFESDKAYVTLMNGITTEADYKTDGDRIILENGKGSNLVLTRNDDGSLSGGPGGHLKKQD